MDRIEWRAIPDPATAALQTGEVGWVETPLPDLLGQLRRNKDIVIDIAGPHGNHMLLRPSHVSGATAGGIDVIGLDLPAQPGLHEQTRPDPRV